MQSHNLSKFELSLYMHWVRSTEDTVKSLPFVNQGDEDLFSLKAENFLPTALLLVSQAETCSL